MGNAAATRCPCSSSSSAHNLPSCYGSPYLSLQTAQHSACCIWEQPVPLLQATPRRHARPTADILGRSPGAGTSCTAGLAGGEESAGRACATGSSWCAQVSIVHPLLQAQRLSCHRLCTVGRNKYYAPARKEPKAAWIVHLMCVFLSAC